MKPNFRLSVLLGLSLVLSATSASAQFYRQQMVAKRCGRCGASVPLSSRVGQRCPSCGAYWGRESTQFGSRFGPSFRQPMFRYSRPELPSPPPLPNMSVPSFPPAPLNPIRRYVVPAPSGPYVAKEERERKVVEFQKKRAAEGSAVFQYDLGIRYLNGQGVEKDEVLAREWLAKSAAQGHLPAQRKLRELPGVQSSV